MSVINQSFEFWEHIIIDDGSTDKSTKIVEKYTILDQRIKLINRNREPKSANTCRNIGIQQAKGKYIIFLDSDDLLSKTCLQKRLKVMEKNNNYDACIFNMAKFSDERKFTSTRLHEFQEIKPLYNFLIGQNSWSITAPIWLKSAIVKIGEFNESLQRMQDPEFHVRACLKRDVKINYKKIYVNNHDSFCRRNHADINKVTNSVFIECSSSYFYCCLRNILRSENSLEERNKLLVTLSLFPLTSLYHLSKRKIKSSIVIKLCIKNLEYLSQYIEVSDFKKVIEILSKPKSLDNENISLALFISLKSICIRFSFNENLIIYIISIICKFQPYGLLTLLLANKEYVVYGTGNCTKRLIKASKGYSRTQPQKVLEYKHSNSVFMGIEVEDITNYSQAYLIITCSWSNQKIMKKKIRKYRKSKVSVKTYSIEEYIYTCFVQS